MRMLWSFFTILKTTLSSPTEIQPRLSVLSAGTVEKFFHHSKDNGNIVKSGFPQLSFEIFVLKNAH